MTSRTQTRFMLGALSLLEQPLRLLGQPQRAFLVVFAVRTVLGGGAGVGRRAVGRGGLLGRVVVAGVALLGLLDGGAGRGLGFGSGFGLGFRLWVFLGDVGSASAANVRDAAAGLSLNSGDCSQRLFGSRATNANDGHAREETYGATSWARRASAAESLLAMLPEPPRPVV